MTNWVYPLGSAADGSWDISLGTSDSAVAVEGWAHTGLKVATLDAGAAVELPAAAEERIVIPLSGSFTAAVDGHDYQLAGRASVFSGPSDVLYTGTDTAVTHSLGRRRPGGHRHGPGQDVLPGPAGHRRRDPGGAARSRQLLTAGPQFRHPGRPGSGPVHRL